MKVRITKVMNERTEYCLGIGVSRFGRPIPDDVARAMTARALETVTRAHGGASLTGQMGAWINPNGDTIREPGITLVAFGPVMPESGYQNQEGVCVELLRILNQQAMFLSKIGPNGIRACEISRVPGPMDGCPVGARIKL